MTDEELQMVIAMMRSQDKKEKQQFMAPPEAFQNTEYSSGGAPKKQQDPFSSANDAYNMYSKFNAAPTVGGASAAGYGAPTTGSMSGIGAAANSSVAPSASGLSAGPNAAWMSSITSGTPAASSAAPAASGSGMGSSMMAAAPWAALAAAIVANESKQQGDGNRGNSKGEHAGDIASGKVLERDLDRYLAHNKGGDAMRRVGMMGTPSGIVRNTKDLTKWMRGLF